jgi:hypothetical protein
VGAKEKRVPDYVMLLLGDESVDEAMSPQEWEETFRQHGEFTEEVARRGAEITGGAALLPTRTATTVRFEGGAAVDVSDGPFAELKEALGGFYVLRCRDLDHALELARLVPMSSGGGRRPRRRRGGHAGRLRRRPGDVAAHGGARRPRRLADHDRPAQGSRPAPP